MRNYRLAEQAVRNSSMGAVADEVSKNQRKTLGLLRYRLPLLISVGAWLTGWSERGGGVKPAVSLIEAMQASLPQPHIPEIKWRWFADLSGSAFALAVLGLLEALAIAKAIAHKSGQQLDYNRQILAEGVGNLVGGFFRAMPGEGSLSRTTINFQAGAVTRFSG